MRQGDALQIEECGSNEADPHFDSSVAQVTTENRTDDVSALASGVAEVPNTSARPTVAYQSAETAATETQMLTLSDPVVQESDGPSPSPDELLAVDEVQETTELPNPAAVGVPMTDVRSLLIQAGQARTHSMKQRKIN